MFRGKRSLYFKCPVCGHEEEKFIPQHPATCPKCGARVKHITVFLPNLLLGIVLGALVMGSGFFMFAITGAQSVYLILGVTPFAVLVIWIASPWYKERLHRWIKF